MAERRGRITTARVDSFLREFEELQLQVAFPNLVAVQRALELARAHTLTVYDATYLGLAQESDLPLATFDAALARAANAIGVPLA